MHAEPARFDALERIQTIQNSHADTVSLSEYRALTIINQRNEDLLTCKCHLETSVMIDM